MLCKQCGVREAALTSGLCLDCAGQIRDELIAHEDAAMDLEDAAMGVSPAGAAFGPVPQGKDPYSARQGYWERFRKAFGETKWVPWQDRPPGPGSARFLLEIIDRMPWVSEVDARARTTQRRALNAEESALLNWWFFAGLTVDDMRKADKDGFDSVKIPEAP